MSVYFVMIREATTDAAALAEYGPKAALAAQGHPLTPLAVHGALEHLEGEAIEGAVIIGFPDMASAKAWYGSPPYQAAVKFRHARLQIEGLLHRRRLDEMAGTRKKACNDRSLCRPMRG